VVSAGADRTASATWANLDFKGGECSFLVRRFASFAEFNVATRRPTVKLVDFVDFKIGWSPGIENMEAGHCPDIPFMAAGSQQR